MADFPTYQDPTQQDALANPDYQTGVAQIDAQAGLNQKTYAQTRQDIINSYQSTLDNLNYGLKQAGLQARSAYAGRNLYNAAGDLSGTGQLVGTSLTQPITNQITNAQTAHEANLNKLALQEQQGALDVQNSKQTLLQNVLKNLRTTAKDTYNAKVDAYNAEAKQALADAKLPGGAIDNAQLILDQQAKGRKLLYQKDLAAGVERKYGSDAIIQIGNYKFLLSPKERADLAKAKKTTTPTEKPRTVTAAKTALNQGLNQAIQSGRIQTQAGGQGDITREQLIAALAQDYPEISRPDIAKLVYTSIPD